MAIYTEIEGKLTFTSTANSSKVSITVDCFDGTLESLSFDVPPIKTVHCGETEEIGEAGDLKDQSPIEFVGSASNPQDNIKVEHTIFDDAGNSISYNFPDDYTGSPDYDDKDKNPTYRFSVDFS